MSEETLKQIIYRAILDEKFRQAMYTNPEEALAEYQLTPEEVGLLANLPHETFEEMTGDLEERISRSMFIRSGTACGTNNCSGACGSNQCG